MILSLAPGEFFISPLSSFTSFIVTFLVLSLGDHTPKIAVTVSSLMPLVVSDSCFALSSPLLHDSLALSRFPRPVNPWSFSVATLELQISSTRFIKKQFLGIKKPVPYSHLHGHLYVTVDPGPWTLAPNQLYRSSYICLSTAA